MHRSYSVDRQRPLGYRVQVDRPELRNIHTYPIEFNVLRTSMVLEGT